MHSPKLLHRVLTFTLLTAAWIITTQSLPTARLNTSGDNIPHSQTQADPQTVNNNTKLSNSEALELLLAAYLSGRITNLTTESPASHIRLQPALLDYEDETEVEVLEHIVANQTENDLELPPDVYEVPLAVWINEDRPVVSPTPSATESDDEAELIISELLRTQAKEPSAHTRRHRSRRLAHRNSQNHYQTTGSQSPTIPSRSAGGNIIDLLTQQNSNNVETSRPLEILRTKPSFNMTVDSQAPFENIDSNKLWEIVLIMRSDCTQMPNHKKVVRWVSGMRGILFECQNGAWVVTYLSKRNRKPRPISITDCHELHLQELKQTAEEGKLPSQLAIHYSDGERKTKSVICKHDERHTNHQLIDNSIHPDPNQPVVPLKQTIGGSWTVFQRRENGNTKFYRSMKRYKRGFGNVEDGEYWLGLDALHEVTHTRDYMLRVEITTGDNITYFSEYSKFRISSEAKSYRLKLGAFIEPSNGTLSSGDMLTLHHGGKFHTRDSDRFSVNCARLYGTAFWFRGCWAAVNLNGPYIMTDKNNAGVRWATANPNEVRRVWRTEMMIKPIL